MTTGHRTAAPRHGGARSAARSRRRKRGWARRTLLLALSLLVLVTAGAGWLYLELGGDISAFDADGLSKDRPDASSEGQNVLVIGSDARTGDNRALGGGKKGDIGRSDTAFLLHVYADHRHALAVSVPRDALVDIPACRLPDGSWTAPRHNAMFNSAFSVGETAQGNPACTQNTVEKLTGVRVDHTVVVDFQGFAELTEVVGGVRVCLPQDVYEKDLDPHRTERGERIFAKGEQDVSGRRALDYVRLRHGIGDGSDIGRIKRQQAFVAALLKKVKSDGLTPGKLLPLADAAVRSMTVDPGLDSAGKLLSFVLSLKDIDLRNTKFVTVPWRYEGARVAIVEPDADALWAALREDRTIDGEDAGGKRGKSGKSGAKDTAEDAGAGSPSPSSEPVSGAGIEVAVYNGTTVTGLAAQGAQALEDHGFTVTGTATAGGQGLATTVVRYGPGEKDHARTVARLFPDAEVRPGSKPGISVTLGSSYADAASAAASDAPSAAASDVPAKVPSEVADDARSAADSPCSRLSYG
ncbi:LCP family protein [Streptomyces niger]|uniref:LCP family protein n=1 Tax=Streptomyces niger TaxID=66373 RepID=UPI00069A1F50|nr:LCP family protein [Streptomyces niger]